jgi:hypothetical protein
MSEDGLRAQSERLVRRLRELAPPSPVNLAAWLLRSDNVQWELWLWAPHVSRAALADALSTERLDQSTLLWATQPGYAPFRAICGDTEHDSTHDAANVRLAALWQRVVDGGSADGPNALIVYAAERDEQAAADDATPPEEDGAYEQLIHARPAPAGDEEEPKAPEGPPRPNALFDLFVSDGGAVPFRVDQNGRLMLTEQANAFIEIRRLADDDGGGFCALLKADAENLCADGETVEEALQYLGERCEHFFEETQRLHRENTALTEENARLRAGAPDVKLLRQMNKQQAQQPQQEVWRYRRKSNDEIKKIARGVVAGTVHVGHGVEAMERDWPALVAELRGGAISEAMAHGNVVAFFEDTAKAQVAPGGARVFMTADTLDEFDYARVKVTSDGLAARGESPISAWAKIAAKVAALLARVPAAALPKPKFPRLP